MLSANIREDTPIMVVVDNFIYFQTISLASNIFLVSNKVLSEVLTLKKWVQS